MCWLGLNLLRFCNNSAANPPKLLLRVLECNAVANNPPHLILQNARIIRGVGSQSVPFL